MRVDWVGDIDHSEAHRRDPSVRVGLNSALTSHIRFFTEYRFTYFEPSYKEHDFNVVLKEEYEVATHRAVAGLGWQF